MTEMTIAGKTVATVTRNNKTYTEIEVHDPRYEGTMSAVDYIRFEGEMPLNKEVEITIKIDTAPY